METRSSRKFHPNAIPADDDSKCQVLSSRHMKRNSRLPIPPSIAERTNRAERNSPRILSSTTHDEFMHTGRQQLCPKDRNSRLFIDNRRGSKTISNCFSDRGTTASETTRFPIHLNELTRIPAPRALAHSTRLAQGTSTSKTASIELRVDLTSRRFSRRPISVVNQKGHLEDLKFSKSGIPSSAEARDRCDEPASNKSIPVQQCADPECQTDMGWDDDSVQDQVFESPSSPPIHRSSLATTGRLLIPSGRKRRSTKTPESSSPHSDSSTLSSRQTLPRTQITVLNKETTEESRIPKSSVGENQDAKACLCEQVFPDDRLSTSDKVQNFGSPEHRGPRSSSVCENAASSVERPSSLLSKGKIAIASEKGGWGHSSPIIGGLHPITFPIAQHAKTSQTNLSICSNAYIFVMVPPANVTPPSVMAGFANVALAGPSPSYDPSATCSCSIAPHKELKTAAVQTTSSITSPKLLLRGKGKKRRCLSNVRDRRFTKMSSTSGIIRQNICLVNNVLHDWMSYGMVGGALSPLLRPKHSINGMIQYSSTRDDNPCNDHLPRQEAVEHYPIGRVPIPETAEQSCQCDLEYPLEQFTSRVRDLMSSFETTSGIWLCRLGEHLTRLSWNCNRMAFTLRHSINASNQNLKLLICQITDGVSSMISKFEAEFNDQLAKLSEQLDRQREMLLKLTSRSKALEERPGLGRVVFTNPHALSHLTRELLQKEVDSLIHAYNMKCEETSSIRLKHAEAVRQLERKHDIEQMLRKAEQRNEELSEVLENRHKNERRLRAECEALRVECEQVNVENLRMRAENEQLVYRLQQLREQ